MKILFKYHTWRPQIFTVVYEFLNEYYTFTLDYDRLDSRYKIVIQDNTCEWYEYSGGNITRGMIDKAINYPTYHSAGGFDSINYLIMQKIKTHIRFSKINKFLHGYS